MVDQSDKVLSESDHEMSSSSSSSNISNSTITNESGKTKTCADCGTTKTPLWRGGPAGPKSLCNACGIRSRKKRRALLGLNKTSTENRKLKKINKDAIVSSHSVESNFMEFRIPLTWQKTKLRRKVGEEERAAMLLMALSCGPVCQREFKQLFDLVNGI